MFIRFLCTYTFRLGFSLLPFPPHVTSGRTVGRLLLTSTGHFDDCPPVVDEVACFCEFRKNARRRFSCLVCEVASICMGSLTAKSMWFDDHGAPQTFIIRKKNEFIQYYYIVNLLQPHVHMFQFLHNQLICIGSSTIRQPMFISIIQKPHTPKKSCSFSSFECT